VAQELIRQFFLRLTVRNKLYRRRRRFTEAKVFAIKRV